MSKKLILALLVAGMLGSAAAGEPEKKPPLPPPPEPETPAPKEPGKEKPGEIVVTASRLPVDPKKMGSSLTLIEGEEFRLHRPGDTWEQLRFSPGAAFVRSGSRGTHTSPFLRGGESDHTLVLLDGFKINDDGGSFQWELLHPAGIGRAEILRGAGTPLFGADAMTGVVQVITEKGHGDPRLEASFEAGTWHTTREEARLIGTDGPVAYNLAISRLDMTEGRFENSDYRSTTFGGRIDFEMPSGLRAKLVAHATGSESGNYTGDETPDPNSRIEDGLELIGFELGGRIADLVDSRLRLGRVQSDYLFDDPADEQETASWRTDRRIERLSVDWQNDAELYRWGPAVGKLTVGLAWEEEKGQIDTRGTGTVDYGWGPLVLDSENHIDRTRTSRHLYIQKRLELWEALTVEGGLRVEDHSTYGTETSSRVSVGLWIEQTGTRLHGSWGEGIKSPTFNENFDASVYDVGGFPTFTQGNPELKPEEVTTVDLGVEQHLFEDRLVAGATLFRNKFRNFINFQFGVPDSTYVNAGKARAQGAEFELTAKPVDWFSARGSLTVLHTQAMTDASAPNFADGRPLIRRPEKSYNLLLSARPLEPWAAAPAWARKLTVFTEVLYDSGAKDVDWDLYERVKLESYTVVNAGINWEVLGGLRLFARVNNVFDERYEQVVGREGTTSNFLGGIGYTHKF